MSWSFTNPKTFDKKAIIPIDPRPQLEPSDAGPASEDQIEAVKVAAGVLAAAIGRPGWQVAVVASGHANPDHGSFVGWGNEFITLTVSAVPR